VVVVRERKRLNNNRLCRSLGGIRSKTYGLSLKNSLKTVYFGANAARTLCCTNEHLNYILIYVRFSKKRVT